MSTNVISFDLELNVDQPDKQLRRFLTLINRTINILEKIGLPPEYAELADKIQQLIFLFNQLRVTIEATMRAAGPIGWGLAAISFLESIFSIVSVVTEVEGY